MATKRLLIVKVGSTLPGLLARKGDFEDWIAAGLGLGPDQVRLADVRSGDPLPDPGEIAGAVVTGSHASVTAREDWSEQTARWLGRAVAQKLPLLGICYGHQLLAHALGGEVADNPAGLEFGTTGVQLTEEAGADPLFGGLPNPLPVQLCHVQAVVRLPQGATRLASTDRDANQAFRVERSAWGVQFHPEFDAEVVAAYIRHSKVALAAEGQDPKDLIAGCIPASASTQVLHRFAQLVQPGHPA